MVATPSAPERRSSPQPVPRHQRLQDDSPQLQDTARHHHEPPRALSPSRRTTTSATVALDAGILILDNVAAHPAGDRRSSDDSSDPLLPPCPPLLLAVDDDHPWPLDHRLIQRLSLSVPIRDDEEEQAVDATARTSTSRTLIVSEAQHDGDETSPPQQDIVQPPLVESPRASPSKGERIEPSRDAIQFPGGSSTPSLDDPLMKEFIRLGTQFVGYRDYTKKLEGDLAESNKRADALAVRLKQSEEVRQKAEKDAATIEDLRKRLHKAETSLRRTHQEYEVDGPVGDDLLDALTVVEIHGDEARDGLENAEAGLLKLFPYFFPKKETPSTFVELAKTFNGPEDLGLKLRQEGLKIGVEGTIALIADSQQDVNWAKVGDIGEMETKKWQSLIKAAKPSARPILSFLGVKPTPAPSASKPEVK
ncbi:hypothetical protein QYE76_068834 [Lolium multiflorum]|uniref:Uncharacterized protein n=1 Tax=Lolium multiflorum TaxID=4521 RepID=A0AAD8SFK2_LOLMU|nr:hypothetical protein QYE76_068834 [Lolium multiflorum]